MAHHRSAIKAARRAKKRRQWNRIIRGDIRATIRKIRGASSKKEAEKLLPRLFSAVDKAAKKHILHRRTADRYKSRLFLFVNKLEE